MYLSGLPGIDSSEHQMKNKRITVGHVFNGACCIYKRADKEMLNCKGFISYSAVAAFPTDSMIHP